MRVGLAPPKVIWPADGLLRATFKALDSVLPEMVAVRVSSVCTAPHDPDAPPSRKVKTAVPVAVVTVAGVSTARPAVAQLEAICTVTGTVGVVPDSWTVSVDCP